MARYPSYSRGKRRTNQRLIVWVCLIAAGAFGAYLLWRPAPVAVDGSPNDPIEAGLDVIDSNDDSPMAVEPPDSSIGESTTIDWIVQGTTAQKAEAFAQFEKGRRLLKSSPIRARDALTIAHMSGLLPQREEAEANKMLTKLVDMTIFSGRVYDGDPYVAPYTVGTGEYLGAIERELKLHMPWQILLKINNLRDARRVRAGQTLTVLKGPCHAVIYKKRHIMDLYLQRGSYNKVFLRRVPVAVGRNNTTPEGLWKVSNKLVKRRYTPAPNSKYRSLANPATGGIDYGQPGYAFGKKGIWIGLRGIDDRTRNATSYGIHSTDHQESIGSDESEGCVRVGDNDIDIVYELLRENWSTVDIRP